jgi:hypothetical protein
VAFGVSPLTAPSAWRPQEALGSLYDAFMLSERRMIDSL